jgi:acetyl esterase/lipase
MYMTAFKHIIHQLLQTHDMRASIFSVEYSLSPEHRWPKATHEAVDAYRYLIHHLGISPSKVVLAGDSAGGNLVATTLFALNNLKQQRSINQQQEKTPPLPLPTAAVLLSPWVDVTPLPSSSVYPMDSVSTGLLNMYNSLYLPKGQDPKDPMVSPLYATMTTALCPLFIAYGEHELIRPSIELFIEKLQQQKNHVTVLKGSKATHIWCVSDMVSASQKVFEQDLNVLVKWLAKKGM